MRQILPYISILNRKTTNLKSPGIFTTIKVRYGVALFLKRHLDRLQASAGQLGIPSPHLSSLTKASYAAIKKNKLQNGGIRITITPQKITIHAFTTSTKKLNVSVITIPDPRDASKTHKVTRRTHHLLAQKKALSQGAQDALFTQNNQLIESTISNIFSCTPDNTIITPPIKGKGLNGIIRQILMENLPIQEVPISITTTNPLILVNSLSLRIVENIDGRKINQNPKFLATIQKTLEEAEKSYIENFKLKIYATL